MSCRVRSNLSATTATIPPPTPPPTPPPPLLSLSHDPSPRYGPGLSISQVNVQTSFLIEAKNDNGQRIFAGRDGFHFKIDGIKVDKQEILDKGDGTYVLERERS